MPAKNLHAYPDIGQAVQDLQRKRIDLVVLDDQPAQSFVKQGGVKIVGEGVERAGVCDRDPEGRRVAAQGAEQGDRQVDRQRRVQASWRRPTWGSSRTTSSPCRRRRQPSRAGHCRARQPTPTPAGCVDNMAYVADLNYDDHNMTAPPVMQPGQAFVKTWRIRNSGTCTWDSKYYLAYASGNSPLAQMGGQPTYIKGTVPPGRDLRHLGQSDRADPARRLPGLLADEERQGYSLRHEDLRGHPGGGAHAHTRAHLAAVALDQLHRQHDHITAGQCVVFSWNVQNVKAVYFYAEGQNMQDTAWRARAARRSARP